MTTMNRTNFIQTTLALVLAAGLASAAAAQPTADSAARTAAASAAAAKGENLAIKRITLYRSGVGSFLRQGSVTGDANVQLRFKTDQINDILKSMVVLDLSGGNIESVSYASKEPLARRLASFGVDISDNPSLPQLLDKLRGASASVQGPEGTVTGTILGVETREQAAGNAQEPIKVPYLNLVTSSGIRSIDLTKASSVDLQDKELAAELAKALTALAEHRADRTKAVEVALRGDGARNIAVSYIHEMPVWKASYRLVLPEDAKSDVGKKNQLSLQGWAIVENPTDEDWNNVTLSLVSGRPVSFLMDLYEPLFVARPMIPVPTIPGVAPRIYAGGAIYEGLADGRKPAGAPAGGGGDRLSLRSAGRGAAPGSPPVPASAPAPMEADVEMSRSYMKLDAADMAGSAAAARAQAVESGEVFQYELKTPITVERQRSAMLPIINEGVEGRRVSIFTRADGSEHPMRGLEVKNSTSLQLLPGPIAVYDGTAYAGDAQIGHVAPGEKRLLSYAVDLDVSTITGDESTSDVRKLRITSGLLEQTNLAVNKITYQFSNKSAKTDRTIIVEHPKLGNYKLTSDAKPAEETQSIYRFEVTAPAGKKAALTVTQEITYAQQFALLNYDLPTMLAFQTQGKASKAVVDAFREGQRKQTEIQTIRNEAQRLEAERNDINQDQQRVRENMKAIDKSTDLYSTYIKKFSDQEKRIAEISDQIKAHRQHATDLEAAFAAWIAALNID